ncbi:acyltransferase [Ideonella sp. B7]|uniref:acyltransferase n=1 Tax=Ideonella benzenivorans TaxID=2831643 RepID=UPI001CECD69B|nr:acyltransferase [Ideonella benzenivorans]MCA6216844.1 acyltransferase [Ideonella benzenivorans]
MLPPILRLLAPLAAILESLLALLSYRWRRLVSALTAARCAEAGSHVYLGRGTRVTGHHHIHIRGRFVAMERNLIAAIESHGDARFNPTLVLGNNVTMENDCHVAAANRVEIHDNVLMASRVYVSDHAHGHATGAALALPPNDRPIVSKGPVVIEAEVWLGEGVCVLPGVRIGRSSIIGANSVVTRDIPPRSVAVGAPARVIRTFE